MPDRNITNVCRGHLPPEIYAFGWLSNSGCPFKTKQSKTSFKLGLVDFVKTRCVVFKEFQSEGCWIEFAKSKTVRFWHKKV